MGIRFLLKFLQQINMVLMSLKQEGRLITNKMTRIGGNQAKKTEYMSAMFTMIKVQIPILSILG